MFPTHNPTASAGRNEVCISRQTFLTFRVVFVLSFSLFLFYFVFSLPFINLKIFLS